MSRPGVLAVLVAHASGSGLEDALESLTAQTYPELQVVVARVGDMAVPKSQGQRVRIQPPGTGFGAAINDVVSASGEVPAFILCLHDDIVLDPEAIERLVEAAEAGPDVSAVGAKLLELDRPEVLQEVGGSIDRFAARHTGLDPDEVDHGQHDGTGDVVYCSAACLLVRREAWEAIGGFDPGAWPLYDDVDLCWRLRRAGGRVVVAAQSRVRHAAAMSRVRRPGVGRGFGPVGMWVHGERGRLRFMLKNFAPASLAVLLPQYVILAAWRLAAALVRRDFWLFRAYLAAWARVAAELPRTLESRRGAEPHEVDDQELLRLASRRVLAARRADRVGTVGRFMEWFVSVERVVGERLREPATWAAVAAAAVVAVVVSGVLWGGTFTLGEIRPFPPLGRAVARYTEGWHAGLDPAAVPGPGIVLLGLLRSLVRSRALAEKVLLIAPLFVAAGGGSRLARVMGVGDTGRRWLAILTAVNPVTLLLVGDGLVGALIVWAATPWFVSALLNPSTAQGQGSLADRLRGPARWALVWAAVVALHPPALPWLVLLWAAISIARQEDGLHGQRLRFLTTGVVAAFLLNLPSSTQWFTRHTPLIGWPSDLLGAGGVGLAEATFGIGVPLLAWLAVALVMSVLVGPTRSTVSLSLLLAAVWVAGAVRVLPRPTAAAAVGWCVVLLLVFVARRVRDELARYELGWRQAVVVGSILVVAGAWIVSAVGAVAGGTDAQLVRVQAPDGDAGRVLWLDPTTEGTLAWVTQGFADEMSVFPARSGPELRLMRAAVDASERGRTHRVGAVLALGDISHVVVLGSAGSLDGLGRQADLVLAERQSGARIYGNASWVGPSMILQGPPTDPLEPEGLAELVSAPSGVRAVQAGRGLRLSVDEEATGVLYVAGGLRRGWSIGERSATPAGAGAYVDAEELQGSVRASAPLGWMRLLFVVQALGLVAIAGTWLATLYLAGPGSGPVPVHVLELSTLSLRSGAALLPVLAAAAAGIMAWSGVAVASPDRFVSAAWYCPSPGEDLTQELAIVNPDTSPARYLVRSSLSTPASRSVLLPGGARRTEQAGSEGVVVESYGRNVAVTATVTGSDGRSATTVCGSAVPETVYFPEGGRAATGARERLVDKIVLYNPFPDVARAAVRYYTPEETISPPDLQDLRIQPGESVEIDHEEQFEPQPDLSTQVRVWQGRAIAARVLSTSIELTWSMGVEPLDRGVFPRIVTLGARSAIVGVNPTERDASVDLDLVGTEGSLPRATFDVEGASRISFEVNGPAPDHEQLLVHLSSSQPLALESVVIPEDRSLRSILPLQVPRRSWVVPAAEGRILLVGNPGTAPVRVRLRRLGPGSDPPTVTVPSSRVVSVDLSEQGEPFGLHLEADGGVVTAAVIGGRGATPAIPW